MEDILASIRRILSEDEAEEQAKAAPAPEPEPAPAPAPPPAASAQDDIDALFATPAPSPEPAMADDADALFAEPDEDILELTDDMVMDQLDSSFEVDNAQPAIDDFDPEPVPVPAAVPARRPAPVMTDETDLISQPVAERSTSILTDLAREIVRQRSTVSLGNGGITLEAMVRELLRPVLKQWLDDNLPGMIERIVKKEIEKMVNRAENL